MLNYIYKLKMEIDNIQNKLKTEKDNFKVIDLNIELLKLESSFVNCIDLVLNNFPDHNILEFAQGFISLDKINKATEEAAKFNHDVYDSLIEQSQTRKNELNEQLNLILTRNPNALDEENKESKDYKRVKNIQRQLIELDKDIELTNKKRKTFVSFLSADDKQLLVGKMLEQFDNGLETAEELLNKAKTFMLPFDLLNDAKYPLQKRFDELTLNKNTSLAKYLLENAEHIKRLTVVSNHKAVSELFDNKVNKVEREIAKRRYSEFFEIAKENKISDLVNDLAQFSSRKIYYSNENYNRFTSCIKEIQTSSDLKDKVKKLLHKFDSLKIVDDNAYAGESQQKEYGFTKFLYAREAFIKAMNEEPENEEKIKETLENLKNEEAKILEMYELIKEELGDDYDTMPSNVDSYRNALVPPCFKNNLVLNAKFNSLFIMLTFIKEKNLNIDNFVDSPASLSAQAIEESFQKNNIDNLLVNKTKAEGIIFLANRRNALPFEDVVKYTRSFELLNKSEKNPLFKKDNHLSSIAISTYNGSVQRAATVTSSYFDFNPLETIQNILMAKRNENGQIPYLDCHVANTPIQEDLKTGLAYDSKPTIMEKILEDENIENTFYEAIQTLKNYRLNINKVNLEDLSIRPEAMFQAVQELSLKIVLTLDLKNTSKDQERGYSKKFVEDVYNMIHNYKKIDELKDLKFKTTKGHLQSIKTVLEGKDHMVKIVEINMNNIQKVKEEEFINEFERINKEIDLLDKQAEKIGKKLAKGTTNEAIEEIALEQQKKFIELQKLQNKRLKELKEDVRNGMISQFYFEKRAEQVMLGNIKDIPAMFMCDDKKHKNFKTYVKEVLGKNIKDFNPNDLRLTTARYEVMMRKSREEKRLHLLNGVLEDHKLSINKSINFEKFGEIEINDHTEEMKILSGQLLESNQKIEEAKNNPQKAPIEVNLLEPNQEVSDEIIGEEIYPVNVKKVV